MSWRSAMVIALTTCVAAEVISLKHVNFYNVAAERGLTVTNTYGGREQKKYILETTGNGAAIFDFDGDGFNDILITNGTTLTHQPGDPPNTVQEYRNDGHGRFANVSAKAGFTFEGWAQAVCAADYDNDGRTDVLITYYGYNRLYHNEGNGKFRDVTAEAGLPVSGTRYGSGCAFVDYDRDGHLDFVVANYTDFDLKTTPAPGSGEYCQWKGIPVMCGPRGLPMGRNFLYHNRGDGTFEDVSARAGIWKPGGRYALQVVAADFDNDGWPDIYVACDMTASLLYRNKHDGTFEEVGVPAGVAYNVNGQLQAGMGVAVGDFDGNGYLDIAKTNFSGDVPSLFKNEDGKFYSDVSEEAGLSANHLLGWGIALVDVDEDGWKDLVIANGHVYPEVEKSSIGERYPQRTLLYRNLANGKFEDITNQGGPGFQALRPARGLATGDIDGTGRPAIVIVNMNQPPALLVNRTPRGNYLYFRLTGTKSNRSAIGARVTVGAGGHRQIDEVMSGGSFYSSNDLGLHFGLGPAKQADTVEIRWPSGLVQKWTNVAANQLIALKEGDPTVTVLGHADGPRQSR